MESKKKMLRNKVFLAYRNQGFLVQESNAFFAPIAGKLRPIGRRELEVTFGW
jgi:hypothetical protein